MPLPLVRLRALLHAQSRIEPRMVELQWVVMFLVAIGACLPIPLGPGLSLFSAAAVLMTLALHPTAYVLVANVWHTWQKKDNAVRIALLTAIDVVVAMSVLFLTAARPGFTQVLLFCVVLLTATRYSRARAVAITTLMAILQFFSMLAASRDGIPVTTLGSAVVAMFAVTYGVNLLSVAERKEAAIAAENARLYRAVLLRNRELATINALGEAATRVADPDHLLESGLELILSSMPVVWGHGYRYDQQTGVVLPLPVTRPGSNEVSDRWDAHAQLEALQAAQTRRMVLGTGTLVGCGDVVRSSTPILVQGRPAGVLQAAVPASLYHASDDTTAQSLAVVCQELGAWVERAALRTAAQRNLVLEEKNRIARELHDSVLQILYSTGLGIEWCTGRVDDDMLLKGKLTEMRRLTAQAGHELRSVIYTLSSKVAEVGLLPALATLVSSFSEQHGLPISLSADGQDPEIAVLCQNALHRVVRESLMNAYKHAGATHVSVRLVCDHETITVVVQDDGVGLPERTLQDFAVNQEHFGLRTISKQIEELDGRFEIMNGEESGAVVRATVPTRAPAKVGMHGIASAN